MTKHTKTNNLKYLIGPTFSRANRLFVLSFENEKIEHLFQSIIQQMLK